MRPSVHPATSTRPDRALVCTMASVSGRPCFYSALIPQDHEVTVTEDRINALMKAAGIGVEPFWPGLSAKVPAKVNIVNMGSLICKVEAGGPTPAASVAPAGGPAPSTMAALAEEKVEAKKEESKESMMTCALVFLTKPLP